MAEDLLADSRASLFDLERLGPAIDPAHDELLKYIGGVTRNNRYRINARTNDPREVPHHC